MLAQSYTPNLYTPPLHHNFFIILSPLFFATVSIPIRFEPRTHPPVEWEHRETKTFTRKNVAANREPVLFAQALALANSE